VESAANKANKAENGPQPWPWRRHFVCIVALCHFLRAAEYSLNTSISVSDFTHELSKIQESHADDLQNLVEAFRRKNVELRAER